MSEPILDRATISEALRLLGERLAYRAVVARLRRSRSKAHGVAGFA